MTLSLTLKHEEQIAGNIDGSVIDIETIGDFDRRYKGDSREYKNLQQVIFGYISGNKLCIFIARERQGIVELARATEKILATLKRPYYAFNCAFESCVWFHQLGIKIDFDGELQKYRFERKKDAIVSLKIPNYQDPFFDEGFKCVEAWNCGNIKNAIAHNRACLLKERDILQNRGYRDPEIIEFIG